MTYLEGFARTKNIHLGLLDALISRYGMVQSIFASKGGLVVVDQATEFFRSNSNLPAPRRTSVRRHEIGDPRRLRPRH